jgi:hypothetical protein
VAAPRKESSDGGDSVLAVDIKKSAAAAWSFKGREGENCSGDGLMAWQLVEKGL